MKGDDGIGVVDHGRLKDFAGFDGDGIEAADGQDVEAEEFVFGVEGENTEFFDWLPF